MSSTGEKYMSSDNSLLLNNYDSNVKDVELPEIPSIILF